MVKQQDSVMHNLSAELSVKTSLYLVFAAFVLSASIQVLNFAKSFQDRAAHCAIALCGAGAAISLFAGIALLVAALVRDYKVFPAQEMSDWFKNIEDYRKQYPEESTDDPAAVLLDTAIKTVDANQVVNERKAKWIQAGAWCLFASLPFFAAGGAFAIYAYFTHPS